MLVNKRELSTYIINELINGLINKYKRIKKIKLF